MKTIDGMAESNYQYETTHIKQVHFKANVLGCTQHPCCIAPPLITSHIIEKGLTSIVALKRVYDITAQNNMVIITIHVHSQ